MRRSCRAGGAVACGAQFVKVGLRGVVDVDGAALTVGEIAVADWTRGCAYGDRDGPRAPEAVRRRQGTGDVGGDECR